MALAAQSTAYQEIATLVVGNLKPTVAAQVIACKSQKKMYVPRAKCLFRAGTGVATPTIPGKLLSGFELRP